MWTAWSVDTVTGERVGMLPIMDASWARAIGIENAGSVTIPIGTGVVAYTKPQLRDLLAHWKRTIVLDWDGTVMYAGIVRGRPYPGVGTRRIQVDLCDLWGLWARRGAWNHNAPVVSKWKTEITNASLELLAKRAVQRGITGPAAPPMGVPITLPADVAGTLKRTYYGYQLEYVGDVLNDLMSEGLEIDFAPRWVGDKLNWLMRMGRPIGGSAHEFHPTAAFPNVSAFSEVTDGARMTNNARNIGEGSEEDMLVGSSRNNASTLPLLDRTTQRKGATTLQQLWAYSDWDLAAYEFPTGEYSFDVLMSGEGSSIGMGDLARLFFYGDDWMADGYHDRRVIGLSGTLGEKVTVTVATTGGD